MSLRGHVDMLALCVVQAGRTHAAEFTHLHICQTGERNGFNKVIEAIDPIIQGCLIERIGKMPWSREGLVRYPVSRAKKMRTSATACN